MNIRNMGGSLSEREPVAADNDCCGNGCVNCVLNVGYRKSKDAKRLGRHNVMSTYQHFRLISKCSHNPKGKSNSNDVDLSQHLELHFGVAESLTSTDFFLDIPIGYHIMMRTKLVDGNTCLRPYSPYWVDALAMEFKILVNLAPNGHMSRYISGLQVGDSVEFRGPIGVYETSTSCDKERCIFVITQGVAIASTIRIVQEILENEDDLSRVYQLTCYKDLEHAFFRNILREFNKYWNYKSRIFLAHQRCPPEMCKNGECTGKCTWFLDNLLYKELAFTCRLNELELLDLIKNVKKGTELVFVIAGAHKFQEVVIEMIKKCEINVLDKNIFLL